MLFLLFLKRLVGRRPSLYILSCLVIYQDERWLQLSVSQAFGLSSLTAKLLNGFRSLCPHSFSITTNTVFLKKTEVFSMNCIEICRKISVFEHVQNISSFRQLCLSAEKYCLSKNFLKFLFKIFT